MKKTFVPAFSKFNSEINLNELSKNLPKKILIAFSIQYKSVAEELKKYLSKYHEVLDVIQILGCSKPKIPKETQAILLISSGKFHAISLAYETKIKIFLLENNRLIQISDKEIQDLEKHKKNSLFKFLNSEKVGVFISEKFGQEKLKRALNLEENFKDKKFYFFLANNFNNSEMENFPEISSWINTACPRIDMASSRFLNLGDLEKFKN